MPTVKINNIDCYYEVHGKGKPLVLIAGLGSDSQSWQPALLEFAKHFKVIVFDNRGIGRTKYPQDNFDIRTMAQDTVSLIDELEVERCDILGHSLGGYIAQEVAINHPQKVNRLILASTSAFTCERNKFLFTNLLRLLEEGIEYELFLREFFFWIFTPRFFNNNTNVDSAIKYLLDYPYPITLEGFRKQAEVINEFRSLDRLDRVKAETLVIAGEKDILITPEEAKMLSEKIANVKLVFLENAAHSIHMEETENFVKCIVDFLQ